MLNLFHKSNGGFTKKTKNKTIKGFTLIELLVAAFLASIVVSSLLSFLVSILKTDQREESKVQTQEEVQAALDFIADDLKEAVYIYDADGLDGNGTAPFPGIRGQLPDIASSTNRPGIPVLVFWRRFYYDRNDALSIPNGTSCTGATNTSPTCRFVRGFRRGDGNGSDLFVYTLVAYYLRTNRLQNGSASASMQIDRVEFRDGIKSDCTFGRGGTVAAITIECNPGNNGVQPNALPSVRVQSGRDSIGNAVYDNYWVRPDRNFLRFSTGGIGSFRDRLNTWTSVGGSAGYAFAGPAPTNRDFEPVLDFVDDNFYRATQDDGTLGNDPIEIPVRPNVAAPANVSNFFADNADCADPAIGVGRTPANGVIDGEFSIATQRIPSAFTPGAALGNPRQASSFYVCVNSVQNVARVWIRGNALARQAPNRNGLVTRTVTVVGDTRTSFITTASIRAFGRTSLNIE